MVSEALSQSDMAKITEEVKNAHAITNKVFAEVSKVVVGQNELVQSLFVSVLLGGHALIEGVPGLAKTTIVKALSDAVSADFQRIQFTPDLLPADLLGTQIYSPKTQEFSIKKGPLFSNIILADEINRAPAKVQSALLEAMQEKQITIGETTFELDEPFVVLATQNPIEQEGTYPLPEAQLDRFLFKLHVDYSSQEEELMIIDKFAKKSSAKVEPVLNLGDLFHLRNLVDKIYIDPKINRYIVDIIFATRNPKVLHDGIERYLQFGGSPRASLALNMASRAYAFLQGRAYVVPQDVKSVCFDVLRHRLILTYEAEAEGLTTDQIIQKLLDHVEVP